MLKEEFEDTKGVIRIRKSKKDRQHNSQKEKDKKRPTNSTHKTKKDRVHLCKYNIVFQNEAPHVCYRRTLHKLELWINRISKLAPMLKILYI